VSLSIYSYTHTHAMEFLVTTEQPFLKTKWS
jgi:hypothetical protein